jgi:diguanylate cyclase (GGDEF)-like protein
MGVTTLGLATVFAERRASEEHNRLLSVSDPLTGLGNYRKLIDALEAEIKRSNRTRRAFVFMLMDLDDLKKVNDRYGHLTGSRALCRLADALRMNCRSVDTPARYGGDEFALILPEAEPGSAKQIADRIAERLANDGEFPSLTVSIGSASFPEDGETVEKLINAADMALYQGKHEGRETLQQPQQPPEGEPQPNR